MVDFLNKLLRAGEGRLLRRLELVAEETTAWEPTIEELDDDALRAKTAEFRERLAEGEELDDILPEAFACVREAAKRTLGMRHFDVQLVGGAVLHEGAIAEMKTGEGKTLVATLPLYLNALAGRRRAPRHGQRLPRPPRRRVDAAVYEALGMTVGVIQAQMDPSRAQGRLRLRHHLRHELRVRLRLPARQPRGRHRGDRAAAALLRDRGRGRLDPRSTRRARR